MTIPPLPFDAKPVKRLDRPTREQIWPRMFDEPLLVTGCMDDWALFGQLQSARTEAAKLALLDPYLAGQTVAFLTLPAESKGHIHFKDDLSGPNHDDQPTRAPFPEFRARVMAVLEGRSSEYIYLPGSHIDTNSDLFALLGKNLLPFLEPEHLFPALWIGSPGCVANLHFDDFVTFICALNGTKRITMFPADTLPWMYQAPFDRDLGGGMASHVRMLEPDLRRFPLFQDAIKHAIVAILEPGDVLLCPPMWWHHVDSHGLTIMVNNRTFTLPVETHMALGRLLTEGIRLFAGADHARRSQLQTIYRDSVLGPALSPELSTGSPAIDVHARALREVVRSSPAHIQDQVRRNFEHFVFASHGEPFPSEPGGLAAVIARNQDRATFFLRDLA